MKVLTMGTIKNKFTKILFISLTFLWMLFIFIMSAQKASDSSQTSGFFVDLVNAVFGVEPMTEQYFILVNIVRKCAHMFEFAVLSCLLFITLCHYNLKTFRRVLMSFVFTVLYAALDEIHQFFVEGRACRFTDVCIDAVGSAIGICFLLLIYNCVCKIKEKKL